MNTLVVEVYIRIEKLLSIEYTNFPITILYSYSFFDKYPLLGVKSKDFSDFCIMANLIKDKAHLTQEGLNKIRQIKAGMNKGRK